MNIVQITDEEYTITFELYEMTITLSGSSESQIALFSTGTVGVEFRDDVPHFSGPTAMLVSGGYCRPDMATGA